MNKDRKYPKGYFGIRWGIIFMVVFAGIGFPISIVTDNTGFIGVWPAIGFAIGLAIGQSIEEKYKKEGKIRPLTEKEKKRRKVAIAIGIILFILFIIGILMMIFLK